MSEITDTKSSLKKIVSIIEEMQVINSETLPKILEHPNNLLNLVVSFEEARNANLNTIESSNNEINSLKNKIAQNERDISKLEENNEELNRQRQELLDKIQVAQNELTETQDNITAKKEELESRTARLNELDDAIHEGTQEERAYIDKIENLEKKLKSEFEKKDAYISSFGNRVEAIKSLVRKNYVKSTQLTLIKALQVGTALDVKNVSLGLDIAEETAKKILRKIVEEGGPIDFDEGAGTVTLKEEVGL